MCVNRSSCDNGRCIPKTWFCDNVDDCGDGSDERTGCSEWLDPSVFSLIMFAHTAKLCTAEEFRCPSGKCILNDYVCDGEDDCGGMEDEVNCTHRK